MRGRLNKGHVNYMKTSERPPSLKYELSRIGSKKINDIVMFEQIKEYVMYRVSLKKSNIVIFVSFLF